MTARLRRRTRDGFAARPEGAGDLGEKEPSKATQPETRRLPGDGTLAEAGAM